MDDNYELAEVNQTDQGFFLPDLCQGKAVLFLVLLAELLAIVLTVDNSGVQVIDWQSFAFKSLFSQWAFLSSAACLCQLRPLLSRLPTMWGAACSYLVIIALVTLLAAAGQWLVVDTIQAPQGQTSSAEILSSALIAAVLAGIALRYFYLSQQLRLRQQAELQARIQALQSRIRPHFLFNSMNIIASLIAVDQDAAERTVEDLSALFRASLCDSNTQVSLAEEIALCQSFGRIEQNRLGGRLAINWQMANVPQILTIPSLTLQPLLENAIYHGIQHLPQGGTVTMAATYAKGQLKVAMRNPYNVEMVANNGNQMALTNIRHRLQAIYGEKASLLAEKSGGEYRVLLSYPVAEANQ